MDICTKVYVLEAMFQNPKIKNSFLRKLSSPKTPEKNKSEEDKTPIPQNPRKRKEYEY